MFEIKADIDTTGDIKIHWLKPLEAAIFDEDEILILEAEHHMKKRVKCAGGTLKEIKFESGTVCKQGDIIGLVELCKHEEVMRESFLCTTCGKNLKESGGDPDSDAIAKIKANGGKYNSYLGLSSTTLHHETDAERFQKDRKTNLLKKKKMILVLDLDHTLIHTIEVGRNNNSGSSLKTEKPRNDEDVFEFTMDRINYRVKLRPHLDLFLHVLSQKFELYVYTNGTKSYAEEICKILERKYPYFGGRIVSREKNLDHATNPHDLRSQMGKTLKNLFPSLTDMVLVVDDRDDFWPNCENLVKIYPFRYFKGEDVNNSTQDHSEPDPNARKDQTLFFLMLALIKIHVIYFQILDERDEADVIAILSRVRATVFENCKFLFSGAFPHTIRPQESLECNLSKVFGAEFCTILDSSVTHLVAAHPGTEKAIKAKDMNIPVVHLSWFHLSSRYWHQLKVENFCLQSNQRKVSPFEYEELEIIQNEFEEVNISSSSEEVLEWVEQKYIPQLKESVDLEEFLNQEQRMEEISLQRRTSFLEERAKKRKLSNASQYSIDSDKKNKRQKTDYNSEIRLVDGRPVDTDQNDMDNNNHKTNIPATSQMTKENASSSGFSSSSSSSSSASSPVSGMSELDAAFEETKREEQPILDTANTVPITMDLLESNAESKHSENDLSKVSVQAKSDSSNDDDEDDEDDEWAASIAKNLSDNMQAS
eukprot:CAMPEP_0115038644 /NCGR_PEP_ID=MMETSP0216-20121206/43539_1 /TAXON_ID=223996 /ORGANISM="Protocruzia adherens, Strain Boccale" /LENGTH=705 /DNA_ID=CAMNT_0002419099 /DNA_START=258 /DNA_END=2375 /DNA_ORIENTATION=+